MNNCTYSAEHWLFLLRMVRSRLREHDSILCAAELEPYSSAVDQVITEMEDVRALIARIEAGNVSEAEAGMGSLHRQGDDGQRGRQSGPRSTSSF